MSFSCFRVLVKTCKFPTASRCSTICFNCSINVPTTVVWISISISLFDSRVKPSLLPTQSTTDILLKPSFIQIPSDLFVRNLVSIKKTKTGLLSFTIWQWPRIVRGFPRQFQLNRLMSATTIISHLSLPPHHQIKPFFFFFYSVPQQLPWSLLFFYFSLT
jgi:hypothetical protein